jgi:hypothetical protein
MVEICFSEISGKFARQQFVSRSFIKSIFFILGESLDVSLPNNTFTRQEKWGNFFANRWNTTISPLILENLVNSQV